MKWFKHDSNANADAKIQNVLIDYGLEGYGLYWYCIELITSKVSSDNITFTLEHDARVIAKNTGSTAQKVEEMMRYFVEIGLFESSNNQISCLKLAKRLDKSMTNSKQMRDLIDDIKSHDNVMTSSDNVMLDKTRLEENIKDTSSATQRAAPKQLIPYEETLKAYHEILIGMPLVREYTDQRKTKVRNFFRKRTKALKQPFTIENLRAYFLYIADNCQWMCEDTPNGKGGYWKAKNFDYIMSDRCYLGVKENRFDDKDRL